MTATEPDVQTGQPWPLLDAARYLRVSVSTLKRAEKTGTLRLVRIGKRVFLTDEELRRVAREGMATAVPVA